MNRGTVLVGGIIASNCVVFGAWDASRSDRKLQRFLMENFTVSYNNVIRRHNYHTLITSAFSHKDAYHLFSNMITLYFFGIDLALILGTRRFAALYITASGVSSLAQIYSPYYVPKNWLSPHNPYRRISSIQRDAIPSLGASGALSAVITYSVLYAPRRIILFNLFIPMPMALFGVGFIAQDLYGYYQGTGNVGYGAHLGGKRLAIIVVILVIIFVSL